MGEGAAPGAIDRFCDDLRRLAQQCKVVERILRDVSTCASGTHEVNGFSDVDGDRAEGGLDSQALAECVPEAQHLSTLARDLRAVCERTIANLQGKTSIGQSENGGHTVLVVDDNHDTREMLTVVLERAAFRVVTAANGLEALIVAHRSGPSLIVMDLQMPILDGIETTRLLKAANATRHIPVIAHTARPASIHVPPGVFFAHVLPKPAGPDVLLALVNEFVQLRHQGTKDDWT